MHGKQSNPAGSEIDHWAVESSPTATPGSGAVENGTKFPWEAVEDQSPTESPDIISQPQPDEVGQERPRERFPTRLLKGTIGTLRSRGSRPSAAEADGLGWDDLVGDGLKSDDIADVSARGSSADIDPWDTDNLGWGDGTDNLEEPERVSLLGKVRRHPKAAAGLLALTTVLAASTVMIMKGGGNSKPDSNPNQVVRSVDVDHDGQIEPREHITQAEIDEVPNIKSLPPVFPEPIKGKTDYSSWDFKKGEVPPEIEDLKPKFVGAYRSTEGPAFNFYVATQAGEEAALDQDFQVHPQAIEYILEQISSNIGRAPENSSKEAIIQNIREIKNGKKDSINNVVVDVSPTAGCLDSSIQLRKFTEAVCYQAGSSDAATASSPMALDTHIMILSAGEGVTEEVSASQKKQIREDFGEDVDVSSFKTKRTILDVPDQQETAAHEVVHALRDPISGGMFGIVDDGQHNTYKEGDADHEVTSWLVDGYNSEEFDFKGAKGPRPHLGQKIKKLVASGELPPILSVKK